MKMINFPMTVEGAAMMGAFLAQLTLQNIAYHVRNCTDQWTVEVTGF